MATSKASAPGPQAKCPHMDDCAMYPLLALSNVLKLWQDKYCAGDYQSCERFKRASRGAPVPAQLLPNGAMLKAGADD